MNAPSTEQLAGLISRKHACLVQLRDLGRRQAELVHAGDMGRLLRLLCTKQHLIETMQGIERELAPFRAQDANRRVWPSEAQRARCAQEVQACQRLLAEIVAQEKQCEQRLTQRRDETAERLKSASIATQARGAYRAHNPTTSATLDLSSD